MKRVHLLVSVCLALVAGAAPAAAIAADEVVLAQDLRDVRASDKVAAAIWTRRPDSYTLQVVYAQSVCQRLMSAAATRSSAPPSTAAEGDRSSYFIGDTIANLRGLDPAYGGCTLTLIDGRRPHAPAESGARQTVAPAPPGVAPLVQVWLLGDDGGQITPVAVAAPSPTANGCGSRCLTNEILYRFPLTEGARATAVAIRVDDRYFIEKLRPLD